MRPRLLHTQAVRIDPCRQPVDIDIPLPVAIWETGTAAGMCGDDSRFMIIAPTPIIGPITRQHLSHGLWRGRRSTPPHRISIGNRYEGCAMAAHEMTELGRVFPTTEVVACVMVGLLIGGSLLGAVISFLSHQYEKMKRRAHSSHSMSRMMGHIRMRGLSVAALVLHVVRLSCPCFMRLWFSKPS